MTSLTKPLPTIGVDKYTFFPVQSDTSEKITYGTAQALPGTVEINPTDTGGVSVFDADNGSYEAASYIEKTGHEIVNADIPPEVDAAWRGLTVENGLIEVGSDTKTVYFGVAWRILKSDGTYRYARYYKGVYSFASNLGGKTKSSQGAADKQTAKAEYTALQRLCDSKLYAYMDQTDIPSDMSQDAFEEKWFSDLTWTPAK